MTDPGELHAACCRAARAMETTGPRSVPWREAAADLLAAFRDLDAALAAGAPLPPPWAWEADRHLRPRQDLPPLAPLPAAVALPTRLGNSGPGGPPR